MQGIWDKEAQGIMGTHKSRAGHYGNVQVKCKAFGIKKYRALWEHTSQAQGIMEPQKYRALREHTSQEQSIMGTQKSSAGHYGITEVKLPPLGLEKEDIQRSRYSGQILKDQ